MSKQTTRTNTLDSIFSNPEFRIHTIEARITHNNTKLQGTYYDMMCDSFWRFEIDVKPDEISHIGRHDTKEFIDFIILKGSHIRIKGDMYENIKDSPEFKKRIKVVSRDIKIDSLVEEVKEVKE